MKESERECVRVSVCRGISAHIYSHWSVSKHACACIFVRVYVCYCTLGGVGGRDASRDREEGGGRGKLMFLINSPLYRVPVMFRCLKTNARHQSLFRPGPPHQKTRLLILLEEVGKGLGFR